jgi:hypothetical protein
MAMPGFEVTEIAPWQEGAERWRGLRARFPDVIASHSREQDFTSATIRRHDYRLEIAGGIPVAQDVHEIVEADGFRFPANVSAPRTSAPARVWREVVTARSISVLVLASNTLNCSPRLVVAASKSRVTVSALGFLGLVPNAPCKPGQCRSAPTLRKRSLVGRYLATTAPAAGRTTGRATTAAPPAATQPARTTPRAQTTALASMVLKAMKLPAINRGIIRCFMTALLGWQSEHSVNRASASFGAQCCVAQAAEATTGFFASAARRS